MGLRWVLGGMVAVVNHPVFSPFFWGVWGGGKEKMEPTFFFGGRNLILFLVLVFGAILVFFCF